MKKIVTSLILIFAFVVSGMAAITPLPDAPSRAEPASFSTKADAFLGALPTFAEECNDVAEAMDLNDTASTSTTSVVIGKGAKSLTVDVSKSYVPGMTIKIARTADPDNWMNGEVTTYNSGTGALVFNATYYQGSGIYTDWTISFSAPMADTIDSYPDYLETDQGITGNGNTVLAYAVAQGTTNKGTFVFKANSGTEWTDYAVSTDLDLSAYTNILFKFEQGARLSIASGCDVKIYSPDNLNANPDQGIKDGAGTLSFTVGGSEGWVDWWGLDGIHEAVEALKGLATPIRMRPVTYDLGSTTLYIDEPRTELLGTGFSEEFSGNNPRTTITYTGTGSGTSAIHIDDPGSNYISGIFIKNVYLSLAANTETGMYLDGLDSSLLENIFVFGQDNVSGTNGNSVGIVNVGSIKTEFNRVIVKGNGTQGASAGDYTNMGLVVGFGSVGSTTTTFNKCEFRQCESGATVDCNNVDFYSSVFESNATYGLGISGSLNANLYSPHFENNAYCLDVRDSVVNVHGGLIKITSAGDGYFITGEITDERYGVSFHGSEFRAGSVSQPYIFESGATFEVGLYGFYGCSYVHTGSSTRYLMGGTVNSLVYDLCPVNAMDIVLYRYKELGITAGTSYTGGSSLSPYDTDTASGKLYTSPTTGHAVGLNAYYSSGVTAGDITLSLSVDNGSGGKTALTTTMVTADGTRKIFKDSIFHLNSRIDSDATLRLTAVTSADFEAVGGDLTVDVVTMSGNDGWAP